VGLLAESAYVSPICFRTWTYLIFSFILTLDSGTCIWNLYIYFDFLLVLTVVGWLEINQFICNVSLKELFFIYASLGMCLTNRNLTNKHSTHIPQENSVTHHSYLCILLSFPLFAISTQLFISDKDIYIYIYACCWCPCPFFASLINWF